MLFILVMDVLNAVTAKADSEGLLQPLATRNVKHRVSLYCAFHPADIGVGGHLHHLFGEAYGLQTNMQ